MTDFNSVIGQLGGQAFVYYVVSKQDGNMLLKSYLYGVFLNNTVKSFDNRKDLVEEGYTDTLYTQIRLDDFANNYYLEFNGRKYFMALQSNHYQKPLGQTLNHYVYSLRRVEDDFETITD